MSGIEIAGIVLAALPLIVPALDFYKSNLSGIKRFLHPMKDVESLIHKLLLHQVELGSLMKTTLVKASIDVTAIPDDDEELAQMLMQDQDIQRTLEEYFGTTNFTLFEKAVKDCAQVVRRLAQCLVDFLPTSSTAQCNIIDFILESKINPKGSASIPQRMKIVLKKPDVDRSLAELDDSINGLRRLTKSVSANTDALGNSTTARASKLAKKLCSARRQASLLYNALSHLWCCSEHQQHEAGIVLDGAHLVVEQSRERPWKTREVTLSKFGMALNAVETAAQPLWRQCAVEVLHDDDEPQEAQPVAGRSTPAVTINPTAPSDHACLTALDVKSLCLTIRQAACNQKLLNLYLLAQRKMRYDNSGVHPCPRATGRTATLEKILSGQQGGYRGMGCKERVYLALNLAASLLRLQGTPWINSSWQAKSISFAEIPVVACTRGPPMTFDFSRPIIPHTFHSQQAVPPDHRSLAPREALLELGIMLLEVWHDRPIESFAAKPLSQNYYDRLIVAIEWYDDVHNEPPLKYQDAIDKCLQAARVRKSDWDDFKFQRELCTDILEPLRACFEPFESR